MVGIEIPAHNEERHIRKCLDFVLIAAEHPLLLGQGVEIDVDSDDIETLVSAKGVTFIDVRFRNVAKARAVGAEQLLEVGARWLAFTGADTVEPPDWLACQIEFDADAVCGTVEVDSWSEYGEAVRSKYLALYQSIENHRHIHGANLGLSADAYPRAAEFQHLIAHRDIQLVPDLERIGAGIVCAATDPVITSARRDYKCRGGLRGYVTTLITPNAGIEVVPFMTARHAWKWVTLGSY